MNGRIIDSLRFSRWSILFWSGVFLCIMAVCHGLRLDDDSYSHYAISVETVRAMDWRGLATDTWNKPLAGIVYGISGLAGIIPARLLSVFVVMLASFCLVDILRKVTGWKDREAAWFVVASFIFQVSFFPQAFLTMNEQLAAAMLAFGLWFYWVKHRIFWSGICFGMVMWARMEAALLVAGLFVGMFFDIWTRNRALALSELTKLGFCAAIPAAGWWLIATIISGTPFWFRTGYVYIREPFWSNVWNVNAVTGMPGALSAAQLLLFVAGIAALLRKNKGQEDAAPPWRWSLILAITFQFVFFSITTVYPRSSGYGGWAIAPLNARAYNILAPLFCLISAVGITEIKNSRQWIVPAFVTLILLAGHYFFQGAFPFLFGTLIRVGYLAMGCMILLGFCLTLWICTSGGRCARRNPIRLASFYMLLSAPLLVPFFWNPLNFQDTKVDIQRKFIQWYETTYLSHGATPNVVQNLNGRLDFMAGWPIDTSRWVYPEQLHREIREWDGELKLFLVEVDDNGDLFPLYPSEIIDALEIKGFAPLARFSTDRGRKQLDRAILKFSGRNRPSNLVVYGTSSVIEEESAPAQPVDDLTNVGLVISNTYQMILHRDPDPDGFAIYQNALSEENKSQEWLVAILKSSKEYRNLEISRREEKLAVFTEYRLFWLSLIFMSVALLFRRLGLSSMYQWFSGVTLLLFALQMAPLVVTSIHWLRPQGVMVKYYKGTDFNKLRWIDSTDRIALFARSRPFLPVPADQFSARFSGWLCVPESGTFNFAALSDDGIRVYISDSMILDNWRVLDWHQSHISTNIFLTAGPHPINVEYFNHLGLARMRLEWTGPGVPPRTVIGGKHLHKRLP